MMGAEDWNWNQPGQADTADDRADQAAKNSQETGPRFLCAGASHKNFYHFTSDGQQQQYDEGVVAEVIAVG